LQSEWWRKHRTEVFELVPQEHREKFDDAHGIKSNFEMEIASADEKERYFKKSLGHLSRLLHSGMWESEYFHALVDQDDPAALELLPILTMQALERSAETMQRVSKTTREASSSSKKFGETSTTSGKEGANHLSDGIKMMSLLATFTTVAISNISEIMKLKPVTGGNRILPLACEKVMQLRLNEITGSCIHAISNIQDSDRAPFVRACNVTIYGFMAIIFTGGTNRAWRRSFEKCWMANNLQNVITADDEAIASIALAGLLQTGSSQAKWRAANPINVDTKRWGYLLHDLMTEIDNGGKAVQFAMVLYMQMVTAIRPRHHHTMALDDSTIKFVEIKKAQYDAFVRPLAKVAGFKPKSHEAILKMFVIVGLHDGTKDISAFRVLAIHKQWLPRSVFKSKNQSKALCHFLQSCSEVHTQPSCHEDISGHIQFHLADKPYGSTRNLFKTAMGWSHEYTKLTSLVRTPAAQFLVAAFCQDLDGLATLKLQDRVVLSSKILAHKDERIGWYYVWAVIDGVGTYCWYRGPRPAGAY